MQDNPNVHKTYSPRYSSHPTILTANLALICFILLRNIISPAFSAITQALSINKMSLLYRVLSTSCTQLLTILPCAFVFVLFRNRRPNAVFRLRNSVNFIQVIFLCVIGLALIYFANGLNNIFITYLQTKGYRPMIIDMYEPDNIGGLMVCIISTGLMPAICEELLFRGEIMRSYERYGPVAAVIISSLLFGLMHGNVEQLIFAVICGLIIGGCVMVTGSIWAGMILHFFNNTYSVVTSYLSDNIPTQSYTFEQAMYSNFIYMLAGGVLLAVIGLCFIKYTRARNIRKTGSFVPDELEKDYSPLDQNYDFFCGRYVAEKEASGSYAFPAYILLAVFTVIEVLEIIALILYQGGRI